MAEYTVINNDLQVGYTNNLPDPSTFAYAVHKATGKVISPNNLASPSSSGTPIATPTRQGNHRQILNIDDIPGLSSSGTRVATPTRQENRLMLNIGPSPGPSKFDPYLAALPRPETPRFDAPVAAARHPETPRQMFGPPLTAAPHPETPRQMLNNLTSPASSGMPAATPTRLHSSGRPAYVSPYVALTMSRSSGVLSSPSDSDTHATPAHTRQGTAHPNLFDIGAHNDQEDSDPPVAPPTRREGVSKTTKVPSPLADQEGSGAPVATPSSKKIVLPKFTKVRTTPTGQEGSGAPVSTPSGKKIVLPKTLKLTTITHQEASGAPVSTPSGKKIVLAKTAKATTTLVDQETSGAPVANPTDQETAPSKTTKVPPTRKVLTPSKPKSAAPKTAKPRTQKPDAADPKTPKRRPSSSHPKTPKPKIAKTEAPPNLSFPLNADQTPPSIRQISLALGRPSPARGTPRQQLITLFTTSSPGAVVNLAPDQSSPAHGTPRQQGVASSASKGIANLSLGQSSHIQASPAQQSAVPEVVAQFARNGINDLFPARSYYAQGSSAQKPSVQQAVTPTVQQAPAQQPNVQQAVTPIAQQARAQSGEYPNFRDGDVMIISTIDGKTWKLHSTILINASPVIKSVLAKTVPAHITRAQREEGMTTKWKLILVDEPDAENVDPDGLVFKTFRPVDVYKKNSLSSFEMPRNMNGLGAGPRFNKLYDNFFKCLYNINPDFANNPHDPEARDYINDPHLLVEAAAYLDAVPAVRVAVEATLLRLNTVLWNHLYSRPEAWIHMAARLQSPLIFREAMLHIIGRFHLRGGINEEHLMDVNGKHGELGRQVWDLIVKKAKELKDKKLRVERHLLEYYPGRMLHKENDNSIPGRAIYSEDIYLWQALMIFRQFCSSATLSNYHHRANDGGLAFYRHIAAGDYLRPETLGSFYECFAMTLKGKQRLAQVLDQIKGDMKPIVKELLVDRTQGDRGRNAAPLDHLTCVEILEEEFPWYIAPVVETNGDVEMSGAL